MARGRARFVRASAVQSAPRFVWGERLGRKQGGPRATADAFIAGWGERLKIDTDLTPLGYDRTLRSLLGQHVLYRQRFRKRRVSQAWLRIDLDHDGHVVAFSHRCLTGPNARRSDRTCPPTSTLSGEQAARGAARSLAHIASVTPRADPTLGYVRADARFRLCWNVRLDGAAPTDRWRVYVDAEDGSTLRTEGLVYKATGSGLVFAPNPMVALNAPSLSPAGPIALAAYREVPLMNLDDTGFLDGLWATTAATSGAARIRRPSGDFRVTRENIGFREVMAYYHVDAAQRYLQSVGLTHAAITVPVDVHGSASGGSSFDPETGVVTLSVGGTPDAEDAEVIVHEYAHAIQNAIVFGFGQDAVSAPVAEGFADYFAATFFDGVKSDAFRPGIASWEAAGEGSAGTPPFERRLDFRGPYSPGMSKVEMTQLWSGCLWAIRGLFGRTRADRLAVGFLSYVPAHDGNLADAAVSVRAANQVLYAGADDAAIQGVFAASGLDSQAG